MLKRFCTAFAFFIIIASTAAAQDRIAVLDTVLPKGIDTGVIIPVTEKIMEEFVRSKLFIVLDRSFIAKTLSEQEFSTSDLTSGDSAKLATIGGFLKATYIIVSTVQKLDTRFFLSAKMIEVKSGVIVAQSSVDRDGTISVLISMAGELGQKLVAASMGQDTFVSGKSTGKTAPAQTEPPSQATPPSRQVAAKSPRLPTKDRPRFSTLSVDIGTGSTIANETGTGYNYYTFVDYDYDAIPGYSFGVSGIFPSGLFYLSVNAGMTSAEYDGPVAYISSEALAIGIGSGLDFPVGPVLLYAGIRGSYMAFTLNEDYTAGGSLETTWAGISYGFEVGGDIRLGKFAVGLRYATESGTLSDQEEYWPDMEATIGTFSLRLSMAF
ncbi:MAG: hypothetical protein CVV51_04810 [Spirochaetae bacterium HGW-Spirochaetae-7]|jgi:TolB-like protein|nr:MAG: hypothetical protein CVV51_04810 [Spirochaetae bacterium HGW-Spirochaetae-7]